jgi:hypothetical protein
MWNDDLENAVVFLDDDNKRRIGFIIGYHFGWARVTYTDDKTPGILYEVILEDDDYYPLEEWTKE